MLNIIVKELFLLSLDDESDCEAYLVDEPMATRFSGEFRGIIFPDNQAIYSRIFIRKKNPLYIGPEDPYITRCYTPYLKFLLHNIKIYNTSRVSRIVNFYCLFFRESRETKKFFQKPKIIIMPKKWCESIRRSSMKLQFIHPFYIIVSFIMVKKSKHFLSHED